MSAFQKAIREATQKTIPEEKEIDTQKTAWTEPEIYAILQEFGHPIQILPFRRAAGHYRDITALVDTNNPTRIPLAYTYREGKYSTQIEIVILSSRRWVAAQFPPPPPGGAYSQGNHRVYQQQRDDHPARRRPSSLSSNEDPIEPTIDLSAWSPRSRTLLTQSSLVLTQPSPLSDKQERRPPLTHKIQQTLTTANPAVQNNLQQIFSLLNSLPVPTLSPIIITPPSLSTTPDTPQALGAARENRPYSTLTREGQQLWWKEATIVTDESDRP